MMSVKKLLSTERRQPCPREKGIHADKLSALLHRRLNSMPTPDNKFAMEALGWRLGGVTLVLFLCGGCQLAPRVVFGPVTQNHGAEKSPQKLAAYSRRPVRPREFTPEALAEELHQRLTPAELELVVNPLATSSGISSWAKAVTQNGTDDIQKARLLFEALERHPAGNVSKVRTAQEVFAVLNNPRERFCCQDYTKLLIAGARA